MTTGPFTDVAMARGSDGIYDLVIDATSRDLTTVSGLQTPLLCSLFSDRRAESSECADPMKRRGWIGNLLSEVPADNYGSGLWLYEQRRGTPDVLALLRMEVLSSLHWLIEDGLATQMDAVLAYDPQTRRVVITVTVTDAVDGSRKSYQLWKASGSGLLGSN